jgi:two-component system CheB/CheR fusion protein
MEDTEKSLPIPESHAQDAAPPHPEEMETPSEEILPDAVLPETPAPPGTGFPIVGIGASAGGVAAFEAFFSGMPTDSDPVMAFVLVQHLAPDHKSILADLVRRYTRMKVLEVEDGMVVHPNCTYIIPPGKDMALLHGRLQLLEPVIPRGHRLPIDFFFRSLAQELRERAIGIVLSGTGTDGTLGVRAIKGEGGMIMAQNPASTEYDGMPRSAIATGMVDYELPPAEMPAQLIAYISHAFGRPPRSRFVPTPKAETALRKIFILLRSHTGHDFSQYKPSTIHRRIERRMAVHQIETMDGYVRYLQHTPAEVEALFQDILIGVTKFFRDEEAFQSLEKHVIPRIFADKPPGSLIRVWSAGCSTGEEAYSLAILFQERMEHLKQSFKIQVFATDIDSRAIAVARNGIYPASIATDITPERLSRFFAVDPGGGTCRILKSIRDMLVFSEQDIIKDPPFSKLDLISCRNLLIYMDSDLQKKLVPLFHYALNPQGFLFLGTSETVGDFMTLFSVMDRKYKLYQRKEDYIANYQTVPERFLPPMTVMDASPTQPAGKTAFAGKPPLRELTEQALLQHLSPVGALVDGKGDILYLHGRTGQYLEPAPGETGINNILKMAREGLRLELTNALHRASATKEITCCAGLRVKTNGDSITVNLTIRPVMTSSNVPTIDPIFYLVILEPAQPDIIGKGDAASTSESEANAVIPMDIDSRIAALKKELRVKEEYLQTSNEELETSNEELKSTNEEMQSVNEELQSTNEELETSKEELQSINEELATVNSELQTKVADLSRINNDMNNLLAGTGIGTVFLDHSMRILRFTPAANLFINLIQSDIGRPVGHIVSNLVGYNRLVNDIHAVLNSLIPKEVEVLTLDGKWYRMHIQPYRTMDNVIEGAVITFTDITELVQSRERLKKADALIQLALIARDVRIAVVVHGLDGRTLSWNSGAEKIYGWSESEALALNIRKRVPPDMREEVMTTLMKLGRNEIPEPYRTQRITQTGNVVDVWLAVTTLLNEAGQMVATASTERLIEPGMEEAKGTTV